ncbi:diacylglycerol kinase family protein [Caldisericum exile]|nr:diacylglycerol kinase family protein [Caldisericum exile]
MIGKVGIIANPQSGKDIRRLVSKASVFDNEEKVNIVERILSVFNYFGVEEIYYMDDSYGIVRKALARIKGINIKANPIEIDYTFDEIDSTNAAKVMQEKVDIIIVIGGDGTNRAVVKGLNLDDPMPLAPISTGTNNAFPQMIESTTVALSIISYLLTEEKEELTKREKLLRIKINDISDLALVDIAVSKEQFIGSKAVWNEKSIKAIFVTVAEVTNIGFSSVIAYEHPIRRNDPYGGFAILSDTGEKILFPIAPGKIAKANIKESGILHENIPYKLLMERGTIALDGERKIEVYKESVASVSLTLNGPKVLDFKRALEEGIKGKFFTQA